MRGTGYFACWDNAGQVSCVVPGQSAKFQTAGTAPALAKGTVGWVLAHATSTGVVVQRLSSTGSAQGAPVPIIAGEKLTPTITAAPPGFVVVAGAPMQVHRLDENLAVVGSVVDLGRDFWFNASVATAGTTVVVNVGVPYGSKVFVIEGNQLARSFGMGGGGKTGLEVALLSDGTSIAGAWSDGEVKWSAAAAGQTVFAPLAQPGDASGGPIALARIGSQLFAMNIREHALQIVRLP